MVKLAALFPKLAEKTYSIFQVISILDDVIFSAFLNRYMGHKKLVTFIIMTIIQNKSA